VKPNTGLLPRPLPAVALKSHFPVVDASKHSVYLPSRKGESIPEVHERAAVTLDAIIRAAHSPRILLVTHAATAIALVRALLGNPTLPLRVGCCSVSTLERTAGGTWQAVGQLASASHLANGVERDWGFEDVSFIDGQVVEDEGQGEGPDVDEGPWGLTDGMLKETKPLSPRL